MERRQRTQWTTESFQNYVEIETNGEYCLLGEYVRAKDKVEIKHKKCDQTYWVTPNSFINGTRCSKCQPNSRKTPEKLNQELVQKGLGEYELVGEYNGSNKPSLFKHKVCSKTFETRSSRILSGEKTCPYCLEETSETNRLKEMKTTVNHLNPEIELLYFSKKDIRIGVFKHEKCGKEFEANINNFKQSPTCPKCRKGRAMTQDEFRKEVEMLGEGNYLLLSEFKGSSGKVKLKHLICGHEFDLHVRSFRGGSRCPKCRKNKNRKTHEQFVREVEELVGDEYIVKSPYVLSKERIVMEHKNCGEEWQVTPAAFLSGHRCPTCAGNKKRNTKTFKQEVFDLVGDEYEVIGEYVNSTTDIRLRHKCGFEYDVRPANFKIGRRCPKCEGIYKRTPEEYRKEVEEKYGEEYTLESEFTKLTDYVTVKHSKCGKEDRVTARTFLNGYECRHCYGGYSLSHSEFVKKMYELVGDEYTVMTEYKGVGHPITLRHNVCGREDTKNAGNFLYGCRCRYCNGTAQKTHEEFIEEVESLVGDEYTVLGHYEVARKEILMRHNKCGWEYEVTPNKFLQGRRCPSCGSAYLTPLNSLAALYPEIAKEWHPTKNGDLTPEGVTSKNERMVWWKCKKKSCGHEWETRVSSRTGNNQTNCPKCAGSIASETNCLPALYPETMKYWDYEKNEGVDPYTVLSKTRKKFWWKCEKGHSYQTGVVNMVKAAGCPKCKQSMGEYRIQNYLKRLNIPFDDQYRYSDCRNELPLPFDFAIFDEAGNVACLIEYDGAQHFFPIEAFGGEEGFKKTKQNDEIKNNYCKDNNITLIRIPYWLRDHVDEVLTYWLKHYQIIA